MASKRWILPDPTRSDLAARSATAAALARALGISPVLAELLVARGVADPEEGARFLDPKLDQLHDPRLLPDAERAADRIARAVQSGERILVHGDYDVDGVCAAALVTRVLRALGANVEAFTPHRQEDGYDLRVETVRREAERGTRLIVTVDCGIVAFEAARAARELGVDLVVTDHHEPAPPGHPEGDLPEALAVVNPKRHDSDYPFPELCGTGVAYKVCEALVRRMRVESARFRTAYLDLVALATCADCMPLVGENRVFVRHGLAALRESRKVGLRALMRSAELSPQALTARSLGFVLGPRINAIGRLDASRHALELLLTSDETEAERLARKLEEANRERQKEQERILQEALRQASRFVEDRILVLASPHWHPGIIGIVASKVTEALCRPTVMVALDEAAGRGRGSCRSIHGFHIFEAISACRDLLLRCGGHQAAAGFDIEEDKVDALRAALREFAAMALDEELLQPTVEVEAVLPPEALGLPLAREIGRLEPFGHGNPEPVFATFGLKVLQQRQIAARAAAAPAHLKLRLEHPTQRTGLDAIFWRAWSRAEECPPGARLDLCYTLGVDTYQGETSLRLDLRDLRPSME